MLPSVTLSGARWLAMSDDGRTAAMGAVMSYNYAVGKVYIYIRSGSTWAQQGPTLLPSDVTPPSGGLGTFFGNAVALNGGGDALIASSVVEPAGGAVWSFRRSNGLWT